MEEQKHIFPINEEEGGDEFEMVEVEIELKVTMTGVFCFEALPKERDNLQKTGEIDSELRNFILTRINDSVFSGEFEVEILSPGE